MRRTLIFQILQNCLDSENDNRETFYFRNTFFYYYLRKLYRKKRKHIARHYSVVIFPVKLILHIILMSLLQKKLLSNYDDKIITPISFNH